MMDMSQVNRISACGLGGFLVFLVKYLLRNLVVGLALGR